MWNYIFGNFDFHSQIGSVIACNKTCIARGIVPKIGFVNDVD